MIKKNIKYYLIAIIAFFVLAICSPYRMLGLNAETISVIEGLIKLPKEILFESTIEDVFSTCQSQWMYVLLPIIASIPSAFYIHNEIKSKFFLNVEFRKGKYKYIYSRFLFSAISAGVIVIASAFVYAVLVCSVFPVNSIQDIYGEETNTIFQCFVWMLGNTLQMSLYAMAMSVVVSFLLYLYNNLCVSMSLLYIIAHLLRTISAKEYMIVSVILFSSMLALYGIMWKYRREYI